MLSVASGSGGRGGGVPLSVSAKMMRNRKAESVEEYEPECKELCERVGKEEEYFIDHKYIQRNDDIRCYFFYNYYLPFKYYTRTAK